MSEVRVPSGPSQGFHDRTPWYMGLSAYWFATSFKWFILLLVIIPGQVQALVPGGEKGKYWGMVFAIGATWAIVGPSLFGYLSDRLGGRAARKPFIAIGAALTVAALMLLSRADQLWIIVVGYLLLQISDDVGTGPYSAMIPELVPEERRGRASGMMGMFTLAAQISVGLLALALGSDIQKIYLSIAIVNIACAAIVLYTIRDVKPTALMQPPTEGLVAGFIKGWVTPWKSRDFFWVWFTRFLNAFGFYLVVTYLKFYLGDTMPDYRLFGVTLGSSDDATKILAMTISLCGAAGAFWAVGAADRLGRKKIIYISGVLMSATILPASQVHNLSFVWCMATIFGVGYGMYISADWALVSDVLPNKESAGTEMGVWQMSNSAVQIFTGMSGAAIDSLNAASKGSGYSVAFAISAVAFFMSTVLVKKVKGSN